MKTKLRLLSNDNKNFLPALDFSYLIRGNSRILSSSVSYMLGLNNSDYLSESITIEPRTYDKTLSGSTDEYGQECITENWLEMRRISDLSWSQSISTSTLQCNQILGVDFRLTIPASTSTNGDFWGFLRFRHKAKRQAIFSRSIDPPVQIRYNQRRYGSQLRWR